MSCDDQGSYQSKQYFLYSCLRLLHLIDMSICHISEKGIQVAPKPDPTRAVLRRTSNMNLTPVTSAKTKGEIEKMERSGPWGQAKREPL